LTFEEIEQRHPRLLGALREHPHIGFLLVHSGEHGPVVLGARGTSYLATGRVDGEDPLAGFSSTASAHLQRTDAFEHVADIMVNSFYDPELEEGCAFESSSHSTAAWAAPGPAFPVSSQRVAAPPADHRRRIGARDPLRLARRLQDEHPSARASPWQHRRGTILMALLRGPCLTREPAEAGSHATPPADGRPDPQGTCRIAVTSDGMRQGEVPRGGSRSWTLGRGPGICSR
jgi:hypothetical protein